MIGPVDHDTILKYYNRSKIFAISSFAEATGKVILEAMSCELPVVASNTGGVVEYLVNNYNGLLFNYPDSVDLAKKVQLLLEDNKLRNKLGKNARDTVIKDYDWKVLAKKVYKVYSNLLK